MPTTMTNTAIIQIERNGCFTNEFIGKGSKFCVYPDGQITVKTLRGEKRVDDLGVTVNILDPV